MRGTSFLTSAMVIRLQCYVEQMQQMQGAVKRTFCSRKQLLRSVSGAEL
jgi:hypothetical protein